MCETERYALVVDFFVLSKCFSRKKLFVSLNKKIHSFDKKIKFVYLDFGIIPQNKMQHIKNGN